MKKLTLLSSLLGVSLATCAMPFHSVHAQTNLALDKTVLFSPAPNYSVTTKGGTDAMDLTDGKLSEAKN